MAPIFPGSRLGQLEWMKEHTATFIAQAGVLGLDPTKVATWVDSVSDADEEYQATLQKRADAKQGTIDTYAAIDASMKMARVFINEIKATASDSDDPDEVYARAQIPSPDAPSARTAPDAPTKLTPELRTGGAIGLKWSVTTGGSATYDVQRRSVDQTGQIGPWATIASPVAKRYIDRGGDPGARQVMYRVRVRVSSLSDDGTDGEGLASEWSQEASVYYGAAPVATPGQSTGGTTPA